MPWDRKSGCPTHYFSLVVVHHPQTGKFLAVEEARNRGWWLPGGFCECGDDHISTAHKETMEEGGIEIELKGVLRVESSIHLMGARQRVIFYAHPKDLSALPKQPPGDEESIQAKWMSVQEMEDKKKLPIPEGWRSSELCEWAGYLQGGGEIYPLSVLSRESSRVLIHPTTTYSIASRYSSPSSSSSSSSSAPSSSSSSSSSSPSSPDPNALLQAISNKDHSLAHDLLTQHPSLILSRRPPKQWAPIHHAARQLSPKMTELLMDFGADVNVTTHKGRTPLHMAAQGGGDAAVRVVELLLEGREGGRGGGSVMVRDGEGRCVFDFASERVLEFLKEREPYLFKAWEEMKKENFQVVQKKRN